jgi:hypothetical protein
VQTADDERDGRFSPDGRWIAYTSNRSGKNEVYVRPFRGPSSSASSEAGGTWTISKGGGNTMFAWGADGKELWYLAPDSKIMAVAVTTTRNAFRAGEPRLLLQPPPGALLTATNGERFLTVLPATQGKPAPFNVVLNWPATLKQ